MTDFGITHLPVGQPHIETARGDERVRILRLQRIVTRLLGEEHGVSRVLLSVRIFTPAITDDEEDRFAGGAHGKIETLRMTTDGPR